MPKRDDDVNTDDIGPEVYDRSDLKQMCAVHGVATCADGCPHRLQPCPPDAPVDSRGEQLADADAGKQFARAAAELNADNARRNRR